MGYWENRQAHEMYGAMQDAEAAAQEIADIYAKASRELNYKIQKIFDRYTDKFDLSEEEAEKLLNTILSSSDIQDLKAKLQGTKGAAAQEILKELESPAYRARIERLQNLQQEIDTMMREVYQQEKRVHTKHYVDQYHNAYYQEIYDLQKRTGFQFSFSAVDPNQLNRILNMNWSGSNYSERIWGNTQGVARELKEQLILAYLTGKPESEIAMELAKKYSTGASNARRLIRTEAAYVSGQGQAAADEECGIDQYRILATLDLRTSEKCRSMDGKVFAYKDMQVGVNYPPFHPWCRTTVLSELDDMNLEDLKRRARDPVTGEVKTFPGDITYPQWYKQNVANNPKALAEEKKIKNRYSDLQQLKRFQEVLGSKGKLKNIANFQEVKYNDPEGWQQLTTRLKDKKLQIKIQSGGYKKAIREGQQGKHIIGHNNYTEGRSYLTISMNEAQELVDKYAGTGRPVRNNNGEWQNKEKIVLDHNIGQYINSFDGTNEPTNAFMIVYAKDGTHIIPARRE